MTEKCTTANQWLLNKERTFPCELVHQDITAKVLPLWWYLFKLGAGLFTYFFVSKAIAMPARKSGRVNQDAWAPEKNTFPRDLEELKAKYKVYAQTNEVLNDKTIIHSIRCRVSHEFWKIVTDSKPRWASYGPVLFGYAIAETGISFACSFFDLLCVTFRSTFYLK